ncbi:MAG: MlaD family protein [Bacteroidia bacterium]
MNESPNKRAIIVGLFVFIGLTFLAAGILTIGNLHETFIKKIKVVTLFEDVSGLQPGNNIWFSGVKIGTVNKLEFYGKSQVKVIMKIDERSLPYIHKDAKVKISTDGLIGNKILVIYGGTAIAPPVEEDDTLRVEKALSTDEMMDTLQANNRNLLAITSDFRKISKKMANGEGTIGQLLNEKTVYTNIEATTASLKQATEQANRLLASLSKFSSGLNKQGTLANQLVTDTTVFNSIKASVIQLQRIADTAGVFITDLKNTANNPKSVLGVMLHDEEAGADLKNTIKNLDSSSVRLNEDLEAMQHNFLLRHYFKEKDKEKKKEEKK